MDSTTLFEAAREGKLDVLEKLLQQNPSILADIRLASLGESVLHVATKSGQLNFVHELMKIDPDVARELNKDGFRPLDVAIIIGNLTIVKTLLSYDRDLGRLTGKDKRTALHYAAAKGRIEIIDELVSIYPDCLEDITVHGETALHLAVKNYQFDAFAESVKWLERLGKESIINTQDGDGNTVLHLAVSTKQYACLNLLLDENCPIRRTIELNVPNGKGLTALDVADIVMQDPYDAKDVRETLRLGGAIRAQDSTTIAAPHSPQRDTNSQHQHPPQSEPSEDWFNYFKFQKRRDSPSETRNALLVVAALIATITFQAAVQPPSGLFDISETSKNQSALAPSPAPSAPVPLPAVQHPSGLFDKPETSENKIALASRPAPSAPVPLPAASAPVPLPAASAPVPVPAAFAPPTPRPGAQAPGTLIQLLASDLAVAFGLHGTGLQFLFANSLSFTGSICIIIYLTGGFPFKRELHISLYSMMFTYGYAIDHLIRKAKKRDKIGAYVLTSVAFVLPFALRWLPTWGKRAWNFIRRRWADRNARLPSTRN